MNTKRANSQMNCCALARPRNAIWKRLVLPVVLGWSLYPATLSAQAPAGAPAHLPAKTYWNKNVFQLPVIIDDHVRARLKEVHLYYKDHPSRAWMLKERAQPPVRQFTFKAPQDGEYWFAVVTIDRAGQSSPADLLREPPGVIVVLDSKAPQVDVRPVQGSGGICLRLEVRDENVETVKSRFEYQTADRIWRTLEPSPTQSDFYCIPHQARITGMAKVTATDRANNTTVREVDLGAMLMGQSIGPKHGNSNFDDPLERTNPPLTGGPLVVAPPELRQPPRAGPTIDPPELQHKVGTLPTPPNELRQPSGVTNPKDVQLIKNHVPTLPRTVPDINNRQLLNSTHVFLNYQIEQAGASGVGKVEIWITADQGQSWRRLGEDVDRKSPAEIDLPNEGLFGVSMVVTNGRGFGGTPPVPGDMPDWWLEVDATSPAAEIVSVRPGVGDESNTLVIAWTARDRNFGSEPIDLYYAPSREGPWAAIAKGVRNDGRYRWLVPHEVGAQTFIRMVATDKAGNSCVCETSQPVLLDDLSRPIARVVGVSAPGTGPAPVRPPQQ